MRRRAAVAVAAAALVLLTAGCDQAGSGLSPDPSNTSDQPGPTDVSEHESGPESPIAYGLQVPQGATQIGPLVRYRSERLIKAYKPELAAAQAQRDAEQQRRRTEAEANGTPLPPPTPTPTTEPSDDTFNLLESPPKPDNTISLMRVDGSPTTTVRNMVAQIDTVLPDAGIIRSDITTYCDERNRRIVGCHLDAEGTTANGRDLKIRLDVDPGDVKTRTSPPATNQNPVMTLKIEYVGDPRRGQVDRRGDGDVDIPRSVSAPDTSGLIWPRMDEDAPPTTTLLNDWSAPFGSTMLLSGLIRTSRDWRPPRRLTPTASRRPSPSRWPRSRRRTWSRTSTRSPRRTSPRARTVRSHGQLRALGPRLLRDALLHAAGQEVVEMVEHVLDHGQQGAQCAVGVSGWQLVERHPAHQVGGAALLHDARRDGRVDVDRVEQVDAMEVLVLVVPSVVDDVDVVDVHQAV